MKKINSAHSKTESCSVCNDGRSSEFWRAQLGTYDRNQWQSASMIGVVCPRCKKLCVMEIKKISGNFVDGVAWSIDGVAKLHKPGTMLIAREVLHSQRKS